MGAKEAGAPHTPFTYELSDEIPSNQIDIAVEYCGLCHSDVSMWKNDWGTSKFPFVGGHEIIGIVEKVGSEVKSLKVGDRVGVGAQSGFCENCEWCNAGDHTFCSERQIVMAGRHGGFGDRVRVSAVAACLIPKEINPAVAGPLLCGGVTVFNPIVEFNISPTATVGVVGVGGLGHLAIQFLSKWGCKVVAFSSNLAKADEVKALGAHEVVSSTDNNALAAQKGRFDFLMVTANVPLNWALYIEALRPRGRLHFVGAVLEPLKLPVFSLLLDQKSVSASPVGSPKIIRQMLAFAARHHVEPHVEEFPLAELDRAIERLLSGKLRFRAVLKVKN
jgi:uncharacterized zinc-type alcohol dehydrogenase-like protein